MLTDTLRDRFGLDNGYIGSDNENVEFLAHGYQGFAANESEGAAMSIAAGVDQDMPGASFLQINQDDISSGRIQQADLDRAVVSGKAIAQPEPKLSNVAQAAASSSIAQLRSSENLEQ